MRSSIDEMQASNASKAANGATNFDAIDLFKFIASLLIFSMHFKALNDFENAGFELELTARWGVPFFFISSAFFLFRKTENGIISKEVLAKYVRRLLKLYLFWFVINLPYTLYTHKSTLIHIREWPVFLKNAVLSSTFLGSWFLVSCIFSAWLVYQLSKKLKTRAVMFVLLPLYLLSVLSSAYGGMVPSGIRSALSFLRFPLNIFNGCFFFAVGKYIAENFDSLCSRLSAFKCGVCVIAFYFLFHIEIAGCKKLGIFQSTDAALCLMPVSYYLFLFCVQLKIKNTRALTLRMLSTLIYCGQSNVKCLWGLGEQNLHIGYTALYLISLAVMLALCAIAFKLQKYGKWKYWKYMM